MNGCAARPSLPLRQHLRGNGGAPRRWPTSIAGPFTTRPEIDGTFGVVASTHWIGTAVGMGMLERGGNAFDAGIATAFTLQVVEPHLCGPGGDVPVMLCDAKAAKPIVVCGQGPAPAGATIAHYRDHLGLDIVPGTGLLPACVPGTFETYMMILRDYGTMRLRDVLEPAHRLRRATAIRWSSAACATIATVEKLFREHWPTSAAVYLPGGRVPAPDMPLHQRSARRDLRAHPQGGGGRRRRPRGRDRAGAARLEPGLRGRGDRAFCRTSEVMDVSGRPHKGVLTAQDMATWLPTIEDAASTSTTATIACSSRTPGRRGRCCCRCWRCSRASTSTSLDPTDPDFVHTWVECAKLAYADREAFYGDPKFVDVPMETLLSEAYNAERRKLVGGTASMDQRPGKIEGYGGKVIVKGAREMGAGAGEPTFAPLAHRPRRRRGAPPAAW